MIHRLILRYIFLCFDIFLDKQKWRYFDFRSEIWYYSLSQRRSCHVILTTGKRFGDFWHIFTAHTQKRLLVSFRSKFWPDHLITEAHLPYVERQFGDLRTFLVIFSLYKLRVLSLSYFYFRCILPTDLESVPRLSSQKWQVPCAKFEVDSTNRCLFVAFCCSCMYVTVLVILTFDLLTLDNGRTSRITWSTPPPSLKMSSRSWAMSYDISLVTINNVFAKTARAPYRVPVNMGQKRGSAVAERPCDALCQLKSCQLLHNFTKYPIFKGLQQVNDLEGHSMSSELPLFDISLPISGLWWWLTN